MGPRDKKFDESTLDGAKSHHRIIGVSGEQRWEARQETKEVLRSEKNIWRTFSIGIRTRHRSNRQAFHFSFFFFFQQKGLQDKLNARDFRLLSKNMNDPILTLQFKGHQIFAIAHQEKRRDGYLQDSANTYHRLLSISFLFSLFNPTSIYWALLICTVLDLRHSGIIQKVRIVSQTKEVYDLYRKN